jgi:hypothetical protein
LQATMAQKLNKVMKALLIIYMVEDKFQSENRQGKAKKKVLTTDIGSFCKYLINRAS